MSGNDDEKHEAGKSYPLDLASKLTAVKTDGKGPLLIQTPNIRGMRLLTPSGTNQGGTGIIQQSAVIKQGDSSRTQIGILNTQTQPQAGGNITIQRQAQITLATSLPLVGQNVSSGATYHVPRGPAVVANLSAPRSNVAVANRAPLVVAAQGNAQGQGFVRPPRTPSPAQGTAWLTNSSNGSQIKGAQTVLSSPVRGASVTVGGKSQIAARPQVSSAIKPTTAILQSAIIGHGQLHSFKPGQGAANIQTLNTTVTLAAQVLPSRTQTLVYSASNAPQFTASPRITVATAAPGQRQQITTPRPMAQVTATRLTVPLNVTQATTRFVTSGTVLTSGARLSAVASSQQPTVLGATPPARITQANVSLSRLTVTVTNPSSVSSNPLLSIRPTIAMHSIVAANSSQGGRTLQTQSKVITQPAQGTAIHLTPMPGTIKSTSNVVTTSSRTINAQSATIVTQRPGSVVSAHTIPIAKVFPQQGEGQVVTPANVYIPVASVPRRSSPGPANLNQTSSAVPTTTVATYSIASGPYFYDTSGNYSVAARPFQQQQQQQQPTSFTISQASGQQQSQQQRGNTVGAPVHGIVTNQSMRFNPIMVVEPNRSQTFAQESSNQENLQSQVQTPTKMTSSPRPSILRKRDHEGLSLKAAKNLTPTLSNLPSQQQVQQHHHLQQAPVSPPSRPDSRNNGHSSGGSTTISATSSPGLADNNEDSMPHVPMNKEEEEENRPPLLEMSPRKKPRKQNLTGNDMDEHNEDMQFITERDIKKDQDDSDGANSDGPRDGAPESRRVATMRKPASASLLNSYRHTWKTTHNHYLRYSDVKPKDERRPTIIDLANQHRVLDKVNGWKIHHLSTQMEDLADQEQSVHSRLTELLKYTESKEHNNNTDINRINELIKGNLQRIKIINDGMIEAKSQIMKIFDHKVHVADIISRCASKRNYKKREKS